MDPLTGGSIPNSLCLTPSRSVTFYG